MSKLTILDYALIHEKVQMEIVMKTGWVPEVNVKGKLGRGRLDLYCSGQAEMTS